LVQPELALAPAFTRCLLQAGLPRSAPVTAVALDELQGKHLPRFDEPLHVLAYNFTRVLNIVGVKPLIAVGRA
jgi:hypothetical protein